MAEEFQAAVCGGSWWSSPTTTFNSSSFMANYGGCWQINDFMHLKTTSADDSSGCSTNAISPDSAFLTMDSSPSTTINWYQASLTNGNQTLPEILNSLTTAGGQNSSDFGMNQEQEQTSNFMTTSGDCTGNLVSTSYGYPSSLLQTLFDGTSSPTPPQPLYDLPGNLNDFGTWNIKSRNEDIRDMGSSVKKGTSEPAIFKRARLQTPSPLPTFKVRKEKLGDRVTALQQLVSPFGKTDTASVLYEAIGYIKLLHDQINVLSNPYMKNGATIQVQQVGDKNEGAKQQDLRSRGLCLVPVSSIFPVATETAPNYWTSGFRSTFK